MGNLFEGPDTAVDSDDETDASLRQRRQRLVLETVSFIVSIWDVGFGLGAKRLQGLNKKGRGGDAVSVEVAVDGDSLPGAQGAADSRDSLIHPLEDKRVGTVRIGLEERAYFAGIRDTAIVQRLHKQRV